MTDQELKMFLDNDKEWKQRFDSKQELIFKEIKEINNNFATKQILCENRFTKMEGDIKVFALLFSSIGAGLVLVSKWIISKLPF